MKTVKKTVSVILLMAVIITVFPSLSVKAGSFETYAAYVAKYKEFFADSRWAPGTAWKDGKTPEHGKYKAYGCAALASDFEYYMYGTYGWKGDTYYKSSGIAAGDIVKLSDPHWFIVLERTGDTLLTAEKHKDKVYISDTHYRISNGVLQVYGYYNKSGKWIYGWKKASFSKGYHFLGIEETCIAVEWSAAAESFRISDTNAVISVRGELTGASAKDVAGRGVLLYDPEGALIASYEEEPGLTGAFGSVLSQFDITALTGVTLTPGTAYRYSVFYTIAGTRFVSPENEFVTDQYVAELTEFTYPAGDLDRNLRVDSNDAVYLLRHTLFAEEYPLYQPCDFTGDGKVTSTDAVHLLRHTLYPETYELKTK